MSQHQETLVQDIKSLQTNFNEILTSGHHYFTNEVADHIKHINNALDNIKLDTEFQRGSKNWTKQFDSNAMRMNQSNVKQLVEQGRHLTRELNTCLDTTNVKNKEENQIRELHSWACDSLIGYLRALEPYAASSYGRLDNLAHHLGVTDRYIGYRHNLSRSGTQPVNVHTVWADRTMPRPNTAGEGSSTPDWKNWVHSYRHYGPSGGPPSPRQPSSIGQDQSLLGYMQTSKPSDVSELPRPITHAHQRAQTNPYEREYTTEVRKAGINLTFPGHTEYMERYQKPEELPYAPFTMNPQPDYTLPGRPLAHLVPESYPSEYMHGYVFPDASKIEKFPWLRSW